MFADKTKGMIDEVIKAEYTNAKERWGDKYSSLHEGFAVLLEETVECRNELKGMKNNTKTLFRFIMTGVNSQDVNNTIAHLMTNARHLAMEACQVAAVCKKLLDGVGK
jgi:hypothetical protein